VQPRISGTCILSTRVSKKRINPYLQIRYPKEFLISFFRCGRLSSRMNEKGASMQNTSGLTVNPNREHHIALSTNYPPDVLSYGITHMKSNALPLGYQIIGFCSDQKNPLDDHISSRAHNRGRETAYLTPPHFTKRARLRYTSHFITLSATNNFTHSVIYQSSKISFIPPMFNRPGINTKHFPFPALKRQPPPSPLKRIPIPSIP
jgi:hypothetical protein